MLRTYVVRGLTVLFVLALLALVAGALLGQPVLLSFVTSESMSPTIQEGDGFVAIPDVLVNDVETGDVVVFQAQEIQGGGLTTHRVVGETEQGFITRGDGNPFTDQDGAEPPVTEDRIVAVAWQPAGRVVTIPSLGTAILGGRAVAFDTQATVAALLGIEGADNARQVGSMLFVGGLVLILLVAGDGLRRRSSRDRTRSRDGGIDPRYAAVFLMMIVVVPANVAMLLPSGTHQVPVDGIAFEGNAEPGEEVEVSVTASSDGFVTILVMLDPPPDVTLEDRRLDIPGGAVASTNMYVPAPPPQEQRAVEISEQRYIVVLPPSVLVALHEVDPLLALGAINGALLFGISGLVVGLVGFRRRRARDTDRDMPLYLRLKRLLR